MSRLERRTIGFHFMTGSQQILKTGTSTAPLPMTTTPMIALYSTTDDTSGTLRTQLIDQTQTGTYASAMYTEVLRVNLGSEVRTGAWANAIMAQIDYGTTGSANGMAATICSEMIPPNQSLTRGALYALDLEFGCGASSSWGSAGPVAFMKMENWGTATHFSANAFLFHLAGETGAAGALLGANGNTIKCRIGSTTEYLVLSEYEDTLSIGLTGAKKTLVTGVPEIAVWSTSALTSGTQDVVKIDYTHTAIATSGYVKGIRCTMTSNVRTPGSFNAIKGIIDYQTAGSAHGDAACLSSELIPPNSSLARGSLTCIEAQVVPGASSSWASAGPLSFIRCQLSGTATEWDTRGYFIDFQGLAAGSDKMIDSDGGDLASEGGIRCLMGATPIWLLYTTTQPA